MDDQALRKCGNEFRVGEDLYGASVEQLRERMDILKAEYARVERALHKKAAELDAAEVFFKKT
ncbi:MAG TPA: DUF1192 domain-containing protein [Hellea balneolensis]|uniref:DUF1192 domain-containing protein n=1 Tax=Hellea balneolensis TaxID=287478 RepID=A0A7C3FYM6_9PROT|nr:DUF1192 domain-containing protein [Hellea balneolensis]